MGIYAGYLSRLDRLPQQPSFHSRLSVIVHDRYGACHLLSPVLDRDEAAFFTVGNDETLQRNWAKENSLPEKTTLSDILLAQIEAHRTEVFYNLDPLHGTDMIKRLPGCVRRTIAWRSAPTPASVDLGAYDLLVCNFPTILNTYERRGWKASHFSPAHDPEFDAYSYNTDRPIDVLFVGGYSRHHRRRAAVLEAAATLSPLSQVVFHLDRSRLTRLAETPLGGLIPALTRHRRPKIIRAVSAPPIFGRELYDALSRTKIVVNGAVDMAGEDRGNMRCWEAMGAGALLLSDVGLYPKGMEAGRTLFTYASPGEARSQLVSLLADDQTRASIAAAGHALISNCYSKAHQFSRFKELAS
jgi:hypothetical protein